MSDFAKGEICPECKKFSRFFTNCSDGLCCWECRDCKHKDCWPMESARIQKEIDEENAGRVT